MRHAGCEMLRPCTSDYSILDVFKKVTPDNVREYAKHAGYTGKIDVLLICPRPSPSSPQKNEALGLFYVGESARRYGFKVDYWDARHESTDTLWEKAHGANFLGFTAITGYQLGEFIKLATELKNAYPEKKIILGGAHATLTDPHENLSDPLIDFVVTGEGELRLPSLLATLYAQERLERVDGVGYKNASGKSFFNQPLHVLDPHREHFVCAVTPRTLPYFEAAAERNEVILPTSRGCPWSSQGCTFCSVGRQYSHSYRAVPFNVWGEDIEEILKHTDFHHIELEDENSAFAMSSSQPFLPFLKEKGITTHLHLRSDQLTEIQKVYWLAAMGVKRIHVGVESGTPRILKEILKKNESLETHLIAARNLAQAGIEMVATFIIGNPTETWEEAMKTLAFADRIRRIFPRGMYRATIYVLAALPGAPIFKTIQTMHTANTFLASLEKEFDINPKDRLGSLSYSAVKALMDKRDIPEIGSFVSGKCSWGEIRDRVRQWLWPIPKGLREWANISAAHNPYLEDTWNAVYPLAGLHFNKYHKTRQNFPGWKRALIKPFEILADIRFFLKYFSHAKTELKLINKLFAWASKS